MSGDLSADDSLPTSSPKVTYTLRALQTWMLKLRDARKTNILCAQSVERATVEGLIFLFIFELIQVIRPMLAICVRKYALRKGILTHMAVLIPERSSMLALGVRATKCGLDKHRRAHCRKEAL
ncbi:hypothetical protein AVEN_41705-1 [Araneus ventricosus]|uniref:Uncharacterized protein n=1 Tax=Araneus ventricosus TaxID=182803 RepID=A0A4Y2SJ15_ARAVE|nr:hypothetical protein AVEN_41705-1 [Araneus ventricosus]